MATPITTPDRAGAVDVHQHLWPAELVDRLRARTQVPYLRGWTLHTHGEAPFEIDPLDHDVERRVQRDHTDEVGTACVSLSAPLGIEELPRPQAATLIAAWHAGAAALPEHFRPWASVPQAEPDLDELARLLAGRFVGLQLPATDLLTPAAWERLGAVLEVAQAAGKPVFVHPGPERLGPLAGRLPQWWAPVVGYTAQLQAAWWAWQAAGGRALFPTLRLLFAAGAGLAPVHHERQVARGGRTSPIDPEVYVDTSSYGPQGLDALVRVLGVDTVVLGSDRPYAEPLRRLLGDAATEAIRITNPTRLLGPRHATTRPEVPSWPQAS